MIAVVLLPVERFAMEKPMTMEEIQVRIKNSSRSVKHLVIVPIPQARRALRCFGFTAKYLELP